MVDTPAGETGTPEDPKNNVTPAVTPPVVNDSDNGEVEKLKERLRVAEQKAARVGQVENELTRIKEDQEKKDQAELEENNQFKELFEQEKAKREELEQTAETKERQAELEKAKAETLSGFSEDVKKLVEEVGIELLDTDEKSVEAFKGKLEKISEKASADARITPNNPNQQESKAELTSEQLREALVNDKDGEVFHELAMKYPGIAAMTNKPKV